MGLAVTEEPRTVHSIPGRMRVHLPGWEGRGSRGAEARLRQVRGARSARVNPLTGNVLIRFDPAATDDETILAAVRGLELDMMTGEPHHEEPEAPPPA